MQHQGAHEDDGQVRAPSAPHTLNRVGELVHSDRAKSTRVGVVVAIFVMGFAISLAVNWPGHIGYDGIIQLYEGRTGVYGNWHPAIMSWMLGIADHIVPGASLFVVFDTTLLFASFLSLLWIAPKPSWAAVGVAAFCVLTPQLLIYPGTVWKDVLFAASAIAAFVCLALVSAWWPNGRLRFFLIVVALAFSALAALVRQNGILAMLGATVAVGWIAARNEPHRARVRAIFYGAGAFAIAGIMASLALVLLTTRMVGNSATLEQIRLLQFYDVVGAVVARPSLALDEIRSADPGSETAIRTIGVRLYSPQNNDPLTEPPAFGKLLDHPQSAMIPQQWFDLIVHHPLLYLKVRAGVFRWVFMAPDLNACVPDELGITADPPAELQFLGLKPRWDGRDAALDSYVRFFIGTPILSHVTYLVLACAVLVFLLRRRRPPDIPIAMMLISAIAFASSFFVISIACDYRYLLFLDIASLASTFYVALTTRYRSWPSKNLAPHLVVEKQAGT